MFEPDLGHARTSEISHGVDPIVQEPNRQSNDLPAVMGLIQESPPMDDNVDLLIVGAGPAGLMLALWMTEFGVKTRIVDKRGTRALHGRADGIHVRSMEIWESFGMVDTVLQHGFSINEWCLWGPDEDGGLHRKQRKCALGTDMSRFPVGMMHQGHIEAIMLDALRKRAGPKIERGTVPTSIEINGALLNDPFAYPIKIDLRRLQQDELESWNSNSHIRMRDGSTQPGKPDIAFPVFPDDRDDIVAQISGEEGSTETVYAKYIVGADGAQSWVREQFGLKMSTYGDDAIWGVMDIRPISNFPDIRKNCTVQSEDGTLLIIPREKGLVRMYVMFAESVSADIPFDQILDKIKSILSPYKFDYNFCDWWTVHRIGQQVSHTYSHQGRVYMTGDALHVHTPKGGQGLNVAIQDSYNLGWKLGMVIKGYASDTLLDTYESERQPVSKGLIEMDTDLSRILTCKILNATAEDTQRIYERLREYGSGVNIRHEPSIITVNPLGPPSTTLQVGKRFPSFQVYSQATGLPVEMQQLLKSDGRWRLMVFAGVVSKRLQLERVNDLGERLVALLDKYPSMQTGQSFLDVLLVHASRGGDVEITEFHNTFFSYDPENGFDYDRVYSRISDGPHAEFRYAYAKQGISFGSGCLVLIRPDQHVGWIGRLDEYDLLENYFEGFMIPKETMPTAAIA